MRRPVVDFYLLFDETPMEMMAAIILIVKKTRLKISVATLSRTKLAVSTLSRTKIAVSTISRLKTQG